MTQNEDHCATCQTPILPCHHCLDRRIERITALEPGESDEILSSVITVDYAETVAHYCNENCWRAAEPKVIDDLRLRYPYPQTDDGLIGVCSRCGGMFQLTQLHVAFNLLDEELEEKPWLTIYTVHEGQCLAHFCPGCEPPLYEESEFETEQDTEYCDVNRRKERALK